MNNKHELNIVMKSEGLSGWSHILQKGYYKTGPANRTVREFIMAVTGYDCEFIDTTVRTIFLNYSPVDDIDQVLVKEGDKLSLGGAMPGLVGIVMGRDNPYKSFREGITCDGGEEMDSSEGDVRVFMKVFSTLVQKTGIELLNRGIELTVDEVNIVLEGVKQHIIDDGGILAFDGKQVALVSVEFVD